MKQNSLLAYIIAFLLNLVLLQTATAGTLTLADTPLATGSGSTIKPNLMFIIDGSGSMAWNYAPDYVNDNNMCQPRFPDPSFKMTASGWGLSNTSGTGNLNLATTVTNASSQTVGYRLRLFFTASNSNSNTNTLYTSAGNSKLSVGDVVLLLNTSANGYYRVNAVNTQYGYVEIVLPATASLTWNASAVPTLVSWNTIRSNGSVTHNNISSATSSSTFAISTMSLSGSTVTVTTSSSHGLATGDTVFIDAGTTNNQSHAAYFGYFQATVTGSSSFTYTLPSAPAVTPLNIGNVYVPVGGALAQCGEGGPAFNAPQFNLITYNPAVRYVPPMKYDAAGTDAAGRLTYTSAMPNANSPANYAPAATGSALTQTEPFLDYASGAPNRINLNSTQHEVVWCKLPTDAPAKADPTFGGNCARYQNGDAVTKYPDATYIYQKTIADSHPVYFTLSAGPGWCSDTTFSDCKKFYMPGYNTPAWKGYTLGSVTGVGATASFTINQAGQTGLPSNQSIGQLNWTNSSGADANGGVTGLFGTPPTISGTDSYTNRNSLASSMATSLTASGWSAAATTKTSAEQANCPADVNACPYVIVTAPGGASSTSNTNYNGDTLSFPNAGSMSAVLSLFFAGNDPALSGGVNSTTTPSAQPNSTFVKFAVNIPSGGSNTDQYGYRYISLNGLQISTSNSNTTRLTNGSATSAANAQTILNQMITMGGWNTSDSIRYSKTFAAPAGWAWSSTALVTAYVSGGQLVFEISANGDQEPNLNNAAVAKAGIYRSTSTSSCMLKTSPADLNTGCSSPLQTSGVAVTPGTNFVPPANSNNGTAATKKIIIGKAGAAASGSGQTVSFINATHSGSTINLLNAAVSVPAADSSANRAALAASLAASINSANAAGNHNYTATSASNVLTIYPPGYASASTSTTNAAYNNDAVSADQPSNVTYAVPATNFAGAVNYQASQNVGSITITGKYELDYNSASTYPRSNSRTDCTTSASYCTYAEEAQNFANWYSFYRYRMQLMKSAVSRAFSGITDQMPGAGFRIGYDHIDNWDQSGLVVPIADFDATQKNTFYTTLFAQTTPSATPLRGSLSKAGRYYGGVSGALGTDTDPVLATCQQNFTFLSTDGYWNTNTNADVKKLDGSQIGNEDSSANYDRPFADFLNSSATLADTAMYYWKTDLRPSMSNDVPVSSNDPANWQHMVTFTMGLGIPGTLQYSPNYTTGGSDDYNAILNGTKNWPAPAAETQSAVDDLWHAAVNGHGIYFSAVNPDDVVNSLTTTLNSIAAITGASAAAATSNLEPVAGDNYAYVANYTTQKWTGEVTSKSIDLASGALSATANWSAQAQLDTLLGQATGTGRTGPGNRNIFTYDTAATGYSKSIALDYAAALAKGWTSTYFNPGVSPLTQCPLPLNTSCPNASSSTLFAYLMGGDNPARNGSTTTLKTYREREHILGDIVHTQPVYVGKPPFNYSDTDYSTYKSSNLARGKSVFVGANDGFLHAFNADTGVERWAFLPPAVLPNMKNLADNNYGANHKFFVDGNITAADVYIDPLGDGNPAWKSIIVFGLGKGGTKFYALDVTDPDSPKALWEFAAGGYSYGNPIIFKLPAGATDTGGNNISGKWAVGLTSGYNSGGDNTLYIVNPVDGSLFFSIAAPSTTNSGLAKINGWVDDPMKNNVTQYVYGGDLDGNMWRFDLAAKTSFNLIQTGEPITVKPELAVVTTSGVSQHAVFFGTGLFLQSNDKSDTGQRTVFAVKDTYSDSGASPSQTTISSPKGTTMVKQTLCLGGQTLSGGSCSGTVTNSNIRSVPSPNPVNWNAKNGWYVNLPDSGERDTVDPKIQQGTFVVPTVVPDATSANSCVVGGYSWLNFFDIQSGAYVNNASTNSSHTVSTKFANALIVGVNVVKLPNGKIISLVTTSDNKTTNSQTFTNNTNLTTRRVSWREIFSQ